MYIGYLIYLKPFLARFSKSDCFTSNLITYEKYFFMSDFIYLFLFSLISYICLTISISNTFSFLFILSYLISSDIKKYFSYVIKLLVKQSDLEKRAKNGFKYIKYPIYIDKENYDRNLINKYTKFMTDSCSTEMQQFEHISPIYKKINWLSGPVGLPIYDKDR